jgi:diacylglycerol kinase (ATP)
MSLKKRINSLLYAFQGLKILFQTQPNAQIHLTVAILVVLAGGYWGLQSWEWVALALCIGLVLALEALNTAIEFLTDLVSPDYHPLAGKAKDVAAAAVLIAALSTVAVGIMIFGKKIWANF